MRLFEIEKALEDVDAQVLGIVQREVKIIAANSNRRVYAGDILMIEAEVDALADVLSILGLTLEESVKEEEDSDEKPTRVEKVAAKKSIKEKIENTQPASQTSAKDQEDQEEEESSSKSKEIELMELAVLPNSPLSGRSASDILLRTRYCINLLAFSREGSRSRKRLRSIAIQSGDLLLMQGPPESILEFAADNACVPLAHRELRIPDKVKIWQASLIMLFSIAGAALTVTGVAVVKKAPTQPHLRTTIGVWKSRRKVMSV